MRIARNKFLVEVEERFVKPKIKGLEYLDTDFNPKRLATKVGKVHTLPVSVSEDYRYDLKIEEGDEIVFNHLVCSEKRSKYKDNLFFCPYYNIYAKIVDGELLPVEDVFFCQKIIAPDKNIGGMVIKGEVSSKCAKVFAVSKAVAAEGVRVGDIIYFTKNADYEIEVGGVGLYKMHLRNIIGIERDGKLTTYKNKLLVKDVTKLGFIGGLEKVYANTKLRLGVVVESGTTGIPAGTELTYFNGAASIVEWKDEWYSFINQEHIKFVL